jgi:hypothetical protein
MYYNNLLSWADAETEMFTETQAPPSLHELLLAATTITNDCYISGDCIKLSEQTVC